MQTELNTALAKVVTEVDQLVHSHGSEAITLAAKAAQFTAIGNLITPLGVALAGIITLRLGQRFFKKRDKAEDIIMDNTAMGGIITGAIGTAISLVGLAMMFAYTFQPIEWAAAFNSTFALAAYTLHLL